MLVPHTVSHFSTTSRGLLRISSALLQHKKHNHYNSYKYYGDRGYFTACNYTFIIIEAYISQSNSCKPLQNSKNFPCLDSFITVHNNSKAPNFTNINSSIPLRQTTRYKIALDLTRQTQHRVP